MSSLKGWEGARERSEHRQREKENIEGNIERERERT